MLALEGISAGYGRTEVLHNVSLTAPTASVVALLGANGAGKTTLLRVASGLLKPRTGTVRLDDTDLTPLSPHDRTTHGLCHIPEGRGIFRSLTVRENLLVQVAAGASGADEATSRAVEAFPVLRRRMDQVAGTMSGGEQQMLALARAYIQNPSVILLDEVSMGLAPVIVDEIFGFLDQLAEGSATLLLVEQYVTRALAAADYVYVLHKGGITFAGEPAELAGADAFATYLGTAS